jgi:atypical dual specificity phosphatase
MIDIAPFSGWFIEGQIYACPYLATSKELCNLVQVGITLILNLDELPHPPQTLSKVGLRQEHVPISDFGAPSMEQIQHALTAISIELANGGAVAVHCRAGLGRTGTMLACVLVERGSPAQEAITAVRQYRPGSIETAEQEAAIYAFADLLANPAGAK